MVIPKNSASSNPPKLKLLSISIQTATSMTDRPGWGKSLVSIASFPAGAEHRLDIGGGREELHCRVVHIGCCRARGEGEPHQQHDKRRGRYEFGGRSEEHTSELQSLMRISYAVFCLKKKKKIKPTT